MTSLIELSVASIVYSQLQNNAFIIVLEEKNGDRRVPIVIGGNEAQSIALAMEKITPPRPITHDLFISFMQANQCALQHVLIYKFAESIFYARLNFLKENDENFSLEARTSDSLAIALRCNSPIYAMEDVVNAVGIPTSQFEEDSVGVSIESETPTEEKDFLTELSNNELEDLLREAIEKEDYEHASVIRDELSQRNKRDE